jgi:hypothetical protein
MPTLNINGKDRAVSRTPPFILWALRDTPTDRHQCLLRRSAVRGRTIHPTSARSLLYPTAAVGHENLTIEAVGAVSARPSRRLGQTRRGLVRLPPERPGHERHRLLRNTSPAMRILTRPWRHVRCQWTHSIRAGHQRRCCHAGLKDKPPCTTRLNLRTRPTTCPLVCNAMISCFLWILPTAWTAVVSRRHCQRLRDGAFPWRSAGAKPRHLLLPQLDSSVPAATGLKPTQQPSAFVQIARDGTVTADHQPPDFARAFPVCQ